MAGIVGERVCMRTAYVTDGICANKGCRTPEVSVQRFRGNMCRGLANKASKLPRPFAPTSSSPSTSSTKASAVMCRKRLTLSSPSSCPFFPHRRSRGLGSRPAFVRAATTVIKRCHSFTDVHLSLYLSHRRGNGEMAPQKHPQDIIGMHMCSSCCK